MDMTMQNLLEAAAKFAEARLNEQTAEVRQRVEALFQNGGSIELRINPMAAKQVRLALLDRNGEEFAELGALINRAN